MIYMQKIAEYLTNNNYIPFDIQVKDHENHTNGS